MEMARAECESFVYGLMQFICKRLPFFEKILWEHGEKPVGDYLIIHLHNTEPLQGREDIYEVVVEQLSSIFGQTLSSQVANDFVSCATALTTNHHGVDYFFSSVNGNILFALAASLKQPSPSTVPVLSFGNIPLNNSNYPRGALLYGIDSDPRKDIPLRLPIFPDRLKRCVVSVCQSWDIDMIKRAERRLEKCISKGEIPRPIGSTLASILREKYLDKRVLNFPGYSQQATYLNHQLWQQMFPKGGLPVPFYIEFEKLAIGLLEKDLSNTKSLSWQVLFHPEIQYPLIKKLDGVPGCWTNDGIKRRLFNFQEDAELTVKPGKLGTHFFWGTSDSGRKIPLFLDMEAGYLLGIDDSGKKIAIPYQPGDLLDNLKNLQIIPSMFTCFLTTAFARGINCFGGYFQCSYLPAMQHGLIEAIEESGDFATAQKIGQVPTRSFLGNMAVIMLEQKDSNMVPAGPIEIILTGGLSDTERNKLAGVTLRAAHTIGLFESVPDLLPVSQQPSFWQKKLGHACSLLLRDNIIVKKRI